MSDDPPEDNRWTIRGLDQADRKAAIEAARRADMNIAEWLGQAIRSHVATERGVTYGEIEGAPSESESVSARQSSSSLVVRHYDLSGLTGLIDGQGKRPLSPAEIMDALRIAEEVARLREKRVPRALLVRANALLMQYLRLD